MKQIKYLIVFSIILLVGINGLLSQELPKVISTSPNVSALMQYTNVPVSYYTGIPNISVPIYTIELPEFALPISLSYHASGIKVNQEASNVGLGWSLNVPGSISRQIRCMDDYASGGMAYNFDKVQAMLNATEKEFTFSTISKGKPDFLHWINNWTEWKVNTVSMFIPVEMDLGHFLNCPSYHPKTGSSTMNFDNFQRDILSCDCIQENDGEPDIFTFNAGQYSGSFITKVIDGIGKGYLINNEYNLDISVYSDLDSIKIIDDRGVAYIFSKTQISETFVGSGPINRHYLGSSNGPEISAIKISRIDLPNGESIMFNYSISELSYKSTPKNSYERIEGISPSSISARTRFESMMGGSTFPINRYTTTTITTLRDYLLKEIVWSKGNIVFEYNERSDLRSPEGGDNPQKIKSITINNDHKQIKKIVFVQSYFNQGTGYTSSRLKLDNLKIYGDQNKSTLQEYSFSYYNTHTLPSKNSNKFDHWGYFAPCNMVYGKDSGEGTNYVNYITATQEMVDRFQDYNLNIIPGDILTGVNRVAQLDYAQTGTLKTITYPTGGSHTFIYDLNEYWSKKYECERVQANAQLEQTGDKVWTNINPIRLGSASTVQLRFEMNTSRSLSQNKQLFNYNYGVTRSNYIEIYNSEDVLIKQFEFPLYSDENWSPNEDEYWVTMQKEFQLPEGEYFLKINPIGHEALERYEISARLTGYTTNCGYRTSNEKAGGLRIKEIQDSNGKSIKYLYSFDGKSSGKLFDKISYYKTDIFNFANSESGSATINVGVYKRTSTPSKTLQSAYYGYTTGYSRVDEITQDLNNDTIRKAMYFDNEIKEIDYMGGGEPPIFNQVKNKNIVREEYYSNNKLVQAKGYDYIAREQDKEILGVQRNEKSGEMAEYIVPIYTYLLSKDSTITYGNTNEEYTTDSRYYYYDNPKHIYKTKVYSFNSLGDSIINAYYRPLDCIDPTSALKQLVDNHQVGQPFFTETYAGNKIILKDSTSFMSYHGIVKPQKKWSMNIATEEMEDRIIYQDYDKLGNVLSVSKNNERPTLYVWGYGKQYPVAEVVNATSSQISSALGITDLSAGIGSGSLTSAQNNALRNIQGAMVTTYTFDPLIGMTSQTDPNGRTTYYEYDSFGRLEFIKNQDGNIIKKYEYKYATESSN